jgi:hypothetical protein
MGYQLRVVVHVPNASLDSLPVDNETMKRTGRDMEEWLTVLVLVRLIVTTIVASSLTYRCFLWAAIQIRLCIYYHLETRSISRRRCLENERGMGESRSGSNETDRRFRRLEKTVESLSHGLILALTQLKSGDMLADREPHHRGSGPGLLHHPSHSDVANNEIESVSRDHSAVDDDDRDLSTAFARLRFMENCTETLHLHACCFRLLTMCICAARGGIGTAAPSLQQLDNKSSSSLEENLLQMLCRLPQMMVTTTSIASKARPSLPL